VDTAANPHPDHNRDDQEGKACTRQPIVRLIFTSGSWDHLNCSRSLAAGGDGGRNIENCMAGEEQARKEIDKAWLKTPSAERSQCIGTVAVGGSPSYVELVSA
jgi:hypothetical protein